MSPAARLIVRHGTRADDRLHRLSEHKTEVTYQVEADPGGSLPRWLAARIARDLPHETLSRLRARVTGSCP